MGYMTVADLASIRRARDSGMAFSKAVAAFATKHDRDTVLEAWHALTMRTPIEALTVFDGVMASWRPSSRPGRFTGPRVAWVSGFYTRLGRTA